MMQTMNGTPIGEQPEPERVEPERVQVAYVDVPEGGPPVVYLANGMILDGLALVAAAPCKWKDGEATQVTLALSVLVS